MVEETGRGPRADELAQQYKSLVTGILQQRGAWQVIDAIQQLTDASAIADRAGYASYLTTAQKLQLLETADLVERLELVIGWTKEHLAELEWPSPSARTSRRAWRSSRRNSCCASSSPRSARNSPT